MDEIGRGTSTFDGLSLAWACARHLGREIGAFTLFATHYFELTALAERIASAAPTSTSTPRNTATSWSSCTAVKEGPANQSYGLQVARLAGVPQRPSSARPAATCRNWSGANTPPSRRPRSRNSHYLCRRTKRNPRCAACSRGSTLSRSARAPPSMCSSAEGAAGRQELTAAAAAGSRRAHLSGIRLSRRGCR